MSYYIYKHLNSDLEIIYVGKTINIKKRQNDHISNSKWKDEITMIQYCEVENKSTMGILEIYFINKLNTKYNSTDARQDNISWMDECINDFEFKEYNPKLLNKNKKVKKPTNKEIDEYNNEIKTINKNNDILALKNYIYSSKNIVKFYIKHKSILYIELSKDNEEMCKSKHIGSNKNLYDYTLLYKVKENPKTMFMCSTFDMVTSENSELLDVINEAILYLKLEPLEHIKEIKI